MARQRRIECKGAICHVMAGGDGREDIVYDDDDRERFEETCREVVERSGWVLNTRTDQTLTQSQNDLPDPGYCMGAAFRIESPGRDLSA